MNTLIISNEEMKDILEISIYLEESGLLNKGDSKTIENEVKEQKGGFLSIFAATLGANFLANMLASKGAKGKIPGRGVIGAVQDF